MTKYIPPLLPLEINIIIARYLGNDVFRLRNEQLPVDLSSDIILYNAIVDHERHERWSSIRRPLEEVGRLGDPGIQQELIEREALYQQHHEGRPKRLIASGNIRRCTDIRMKHPVVRYGYLAYEMEDSGPTLVIRDLVRRLEWSIRLESYGCYTITATKVVFSTESILMRIALEDLDRMERDTGTDNDIIERHTICTSNYEQISAIAGYDETVAVLCDNGPEWVSRLQLWKDGICTDIAEYPVLFDHGNRALEIDSSSRIIHAYLASEGQQCVVMEMYSIEGECLSKMSFKYMKHRHEQSFTTLRYTGTAWCVVVAEKNDVYRTNWTPAWGASVSDANVCEWKGMLYSVHRNDIRVSSLRHPYSWHEFRIDRYPGVMRFLSLQEGEEIIDLHVDDSFLVVVLADKSDAAAVMARWFVFTFDDLPGQELSSEPVMDEFYWSPKPRRNRALDWKWYD